MSPHKMPRPHIKWSRYVTPFIQTSVQKRVAAYRHALAALPLGMRPGTPFTEGWVDLVVGYDGYGKPHPYRAPNAGLSNQ
jgi:hypothetical protein